ncbi:MAG: DUF6145 family protein [Lachnospiraceae bacterium]|nr:DUF6145 family protein [Lachnospiraceae bacterium]
MEDTSENTVLCGANSYQRKYYFNEKFKKLPDDVKNALKVLCVLHTEDVGGVLMLEFTPEGELILREEVDEADYNFDEIGSALKIKQYRDEYGEMFRALELFYQAVVRLGV